MQRSAQAEPERAGPTSPSSAVTPQPHRRRRLSPPRSLLVLLGIVAVVGIGWALLTPPWQAPDEISHFAYSEGLATNFVVPPMPDRGGLSSAQQGAEGANATNPATFYPQSAPPSWSDGAFSAYLKTQRGLSASDGDGQDSAQANPPLYYLYSDLGYLLDKGGTEFGRLYDMHLSGVLLLLVTTLGAWLVAGEALGRRRLPQLVCASVAGLMPMVAFMSTSVNPDGLLTAGWTVALWLGLRVVNHRARPADVIGLAAACAATILTKTTGYALLPCAVMAIATGWLRRPRPERARALIPIAAAAAVAAVPLLVWLAIAHAAGTAGFNTVGTTAAHPVNIRQFISYVWQFYLPRLPFLTPYRLVGGLPVYEVFIKQGLGTFGWLTVSLPGWLYPLAALILAALALACITFMARLRARLPWLRIAFLLINALSLLALLHIGEYLVAIDGGGAFIQGRYLLPVVSLLGLAVALVVRMLPPRAATISAGVVMCGLLGLQVVSMSAVLQGFYL